MGIIILILAILVFYVVPGVLAYLIVQHDFKTRFKSIKPGMVDLFFVVAPYFNIMTVLITMVEYLAKYIKSKTKERTGKTLVQRFFRL